MKFTVNRNIMLESLKSMYKIVPQNSPIKEMKGFLIEANEDDGYLYMTANNLHTAIQRKTKPIIESTGSFVIDAKLIVEMLSLLEGETVTFNEYSKGILNIRSGSCTFEVKTLDDKLFPRPDIPFPNTTFKVSNIRQLYLKTHSAVATTGDSQTLKGIHFETTNDKLRVIGSNLQGVALATVEMNCGGNLNFTLDKNVFSNVAMAVGDDELEVGVCGNNVVFMKEGLLVTARMLMLEYVKVDRIFESLQTDYVARVENKELQECISSVYNVASMSKPTSYIRFDFAEDKITMSTQNNVGSTTNTVDVIKIQGSENKTFYYKAKALEELFKTVEGTLILRLDKNGYIVFMDKDNQYLMMPMSEAIVQRQAEGYIEKKEKKPKAKMVEQEKKAA